MPQNNLISVRILFFFSAILVSLSKLSVMSKSYYSFPKISHDGEYQDQLKTAHKVSLR